MATGPLLPWRSSVFEQLRHPDFVPFSSKSYKQGGLLGEFSRNFTLKKHKQILKTPKKTPNQTNPKQASPPQETNERHEETKPEVWGRRCRVLSPWSMEYPSLQDGSIPAGQSHPSRTGPSLQDRVIPARTGPSQQDGVHPCRTGSTPAG